MTVEESLAAFAPVLERAGELGWWRRGYVSTAFGCPYTGRVDPARAVDVARRLLELGVDEVCFGDTIGVGVPGQVAALTGLAVAGRDPARADRLPLPRHARHGAGQRRGRPRCRGPLLRLVDRRAPAAVRTRPEPPAISPRRTSSTSSTRPAGSTASRSTGSSSPPGSSPKRSAGRSRRRSARRVAGTIPRGRQRVAGSRPARSRASAIVPLDGRCRARSEPELRTAQRL